MRNVLVIAYYFPPMGLSGVQRTLKFVKYLPAFGWKPTVLTVTTTGYFAKDESLLQEVEDLGVRVLRTASIDPNRLFEHREVVRMPAERIRKILSRISDTLFVPDNKIGWRRAAVRSASALLAAEKFDVIFATAPPQTDFLIGKALKEKFHLPLVIDYRDAWVDYPFKFYLTPLHKYANIRLERSALRAADSIITASRSVKESILRRYKFLSYGDVQIIPQGFDPDDILGAAKAPLLKTDKMRVTYSGTFYENRSPQTFLEALQLVFKEQPRLQGRIEACFVGAFRAEHKKIVNRLALQNDVNILGYLQHHECVRYLLASDVLWVMMRDDRSSPGKIYEYIGTQKKILGLVPEGFMSHVIEEAGGMCVGPKDVRGVANALIELYGQYERHQVTGPRPDVVDKYNRRILTGDLAKVLSNLAE